MSLDNDTTSKVVSAGVKQGPRVLEEPDELAIISYLARAFDRSYSSLGVKARLPRNTDLKSAEGLARGLAAIGLKSRIVFRDIGAIDSIALPFVVFQKNGNPLVVLEVSSDGNSVTTIDPQIEELAREESPRALRKKIEKYIVLVTRSEAAVQSRLTPEALDAASNKTHWFWGAVRANWRQWIQIVVAALLLNSLTLALPLFVMNVYDKVIPNLAYVTLWTLAVGVGIALLLDLILRTMRGNILETASRRVDIKVASVLFRQAMHARLLDRPGGAAAIASTIRDFEVVREFFASATFVALIDFLFIGIFIVALFLVVGPIAWVPLLAVPVVLILALLAQLPLGHAAVRSQQMATKRHTVLIEALAGIETIKSLNAEPTLQREWENTVAASSQINGLTKFWSGIAANGTTVVQQAVSVLIIVWGVFMVSDGAITIGGLIAANILAGRVLSPLGTIAQTIFRAQYASRSLSALNDFMALPVEQTPSVSSDAKVLKGSVVLRDVSFTYPQASVPALKDLSFDIGSGECVALLGRVGSGKTTVGKVISGLIPSDSGTVLVDGIALDQYDPAELRRGIGYLPQTQELFTGTLRENLTIGAADATDTDIKSAMYFAAMDEFLAAIPEGLDFFVGEQGARLSGGQKQGLALARLLLRRPRMLFLDEPTNAMDQKMQSQIVERFRELNAEGVGLIISTHRQTLAAMADRLIVMEQGRAILDGARDDVLTRLRGLASKGAS